MTARNLEFLFRPKSVAVVAEPKEPTRYAEVVLRNLAAGGFHGAVMSANAKLHSTFGIGSRIRLDKLKAIKEARKKAQPAPVTPEETVAAPEAPAATA